MTIYVTVAVSIPDNHYDPNIDYVKTSLGRSNFLEKVGR